MSLELYYFSGGPRERVLRAVLGAGHRVRGVFVNDPVRWPKVTPTIELAREYGLTVEIVSKKIDLRAVGERLSGQLLLSAGFAYLFPAEFLARVGTCLNVHGSLLPKYPGARTLSWAIEDGETASGVTVHLVDQGMDTGPILLQESFPLSPFETTASLARKTRDFEPHVVVRALRRFEEHGAAAFTAQAPHTAAIPPNRVPSHSQVDPSKPLSELYDKIRAANPDHYPAYFYWQGQKVCIRMWRPDKPPGEEDLV